MAQRIGYVDAEHRPAAGDRSVVLARKPPGTRARRKRPSPHHADALMAGDIDADLRGQRAPYRMERGLLGEPGHGRIDTFVFDGDSITVQTVCYTLEKTG